MSVPHKCPVCEGKGKVPGYFYDTVTVPSPALEPIACRACNGGGVLWGVNGLTIPYYPPTWPTYPYPFWCIDTNLPYGSGGLIASSNSGVVEPRSLGPVSTIGWEQKPEGDLEGVLVG